MRAICSILFGLGFIYNDFRFQGSILAQESQKSQTEGEKGFEEGQKVLGNQSSLCHQDPQEPSRLYLACKGPKATSHGFTSLEVQLPRCEHYEKSLVRLLRNSFFADAMDPDIHAQQFTTEKRSWQESGFSERSEGGEDRSTQTLYSRIARKVDTLEGIYTDDAHPTVDAGKAGYTVSRRSGGDPPTGKQRQSKGRSQCRLLEEGDGARGHEGSSRSHQESTRQQLDRRDEESTRENDKLAREAKAQTYPLPFEQSGTCSQGCRYPEEKDSGLRHSLGEIQNGGRGKSCDPEDKLSRTEKGSQRSVCAKGRTTQGSSVGDSEGGQSGIDIRGGGPGRGRCRSRHQLRCRHRGDPRHGREPCRAKASKETEDGESGESKRLSTQCVGLAPCFKACQPLPELSCVLAPFLKAADGGDEKNERTLIFENTTRFQECMTRIVRLAQFWIMTGIWMIEPVTWLEENVRKAMPQQFFESNGSLDCFPHLQEVLRQGNPEDSVLTSLLAHGREMRYENWSMILWDDEWIAFFFGVIVLMIFLGSSSLLIDFCGELFALWRYRGEGSKHERRLVKICRRRCSQRKRHPKEGGRNVSFFMRYLLLWHFCFPFVHGMASTSFFTERAGTSDSDEAFLVQRMGHAHSGWEPQLRDWLGIRQLRGNQTLTRVWQHQWKRRYVSDSVGQDIWVDRRLNIEGQIRSSLLFMDDEEPLRWSKVTPTPDSHVYKRVHILATGIPYPFFLAVLAEVNNGERTWYQTVIVEHQNNMVDLVNFFNLVWRHNQCAEDHECYILQPHRTDWPEQADLFEGELVSVFHLPRSRERLRQTSNSSECTEAGDDFSLPTSSDEEYVSLVCTRITLQRHIHYGMNWAAGSYPDQQRMHSELGRRIEDTRVNFEAWERDLRQEALDHTQVQGQEIITDSILGEAENRGGYARLHVHGIIAQEVDVQKIWLDTRQVRDFVDLLVILRGLWPMDRPSQDMNLHFVCEQPTDTMNEDVGITTLIMDLLPTARMLPILVVTRMDQEGYEDSYDIRAHKHEALISCGDLKRITGLSMVCSFNARCVCTRDHNVILEDELIPIPAGTMLMIHIYFDLQRCRSEDRMNRNDSIGDEMGMMQNPLTNFLSAAADPFTMTWLYGYCHGLLEPIRAWKGGAGELTSDVYLSQQFARILDTVLKDHILAYKVFPLPADLMRRFTEAYVLILEDEIKPWERLILLDITWENQQDHLGAIGLGQEENLREAKIVDHQTTRDLFLRKVGMELQCSRPQKNCIVTIRGRHWSEEHDLATILNGDYCTIVVRNRPLSTAPKLTTEALDALCTDEPVAKPRDQQSHPSIETQHHNASDAGSNKGTLAQSERPNERPAVGSSESIQHNDDSSLMQMYSPGTHSNTSMPHGNSSCLIPMDRADYEFQAEEEARQRIIQQANEQLRLLIQETVDLAGEYQILEEIRGLLGRQDSRISLVTHGLAARHLGTKRIDLERGRALDTQYICRKIADAWLDDIQWHNMRIIFVSPQPYGVDPEERDLIHLLVDFRPDLVGIPLLVQVSFMFHGGEEGEFETTRTRDTLVYEIFERLGLTHICEQTEATCYFSTLRVRYFQLEDRLPIPVGSYFMIDIYRGEAMMDHDQDELMLMTTDMTRRQIRYFFVYRADDSEPTAIQRFDPEQVPIPGRTDAERLSYQYLRSGKSNGERSVTMYYLNDQPEDMFIHSAIGYMAVDDELASNKGALTLVDIGFYVRGSQRTIRGHVPNDEWRETKFLPWTLDKAVLIRKLGLQNFCREAEDVCDVWHRGVLWTEGARELSHGDYIVAKILQRNENLPLHLQWQLAQDCDEDLLDSLREQPRSSTFDGGNASLPIEDGPNGTGLDLVADQNAGPEDREDDDVSILLAVRWNQSRWAASATTRARERLPPPGNGPVSFSKWVTIYDDSGQHIREDRSCENPYIAGFCATRADDIIENPFFKDCVQHVRFGQAQERVDSICIGREREKTPPDMCAGPQSQPISLPIRINLSEAIGHEYFLPVACDEAQKIDLAPLREFHRRISMHSTLPEIDKTKVAWKSNAHEWLAYPHWEFGEVDELHFYVDGSFAGKKRGIGIVLFPRCGPLWTFGGYIRESIDRGNSAYQSELGAILIALKWAWDLLRAFMASGFMTPRIIIHFDSASAGLAVAGECAGNLDEPFFVSARAMVHLIQTQFNLEIEFKKEAAHSGNPGNEMADDLANEGRNLPVNDFWTMLCSPQALQLLPWIWILHDVTLQPFFDKDSLCIPKPRNYNDPELSKDIKGHENTLKFDTSISVSAS